jgi:D-glycero-alpha-D-manno-heptose 1-phosphate guanylyltransferase
MEAIVLAGGFGTRLRQVVSDVPKPMAPIAGRPFLEILLSQLALKNFKRVILSIGYMGEIIKDHFKDKYMDMDLVYVEEKTPLGTGGAVRFAMDKVVENHVYVFNGDTFLDLEVHHVEEKWKHNKNPIIIARLLKDTARYGRLTIKNEIVTGFSEKGVEGPGYINAGCYVFNKNQLDNFESGKIFSLEQDFLEKEVTKARFDVFFTNGRFIDIGIPEDYFRASFEI